jgi:hypothetical protein
MGAGTPFPTATRGAATTPTITANHCYVGYDGNGNVVVLILAHGETARQPRAQFESDLVTGS